MSSSPPKWADKLLERICRKDLLEEIQGDLHESYQWRSETKGSAFAKRQFIKETLLSFKLSNLKPYDKMDRLLTLVKSHVKIGWRFIWKTKAYSAINLLGLSIGIVFSWFAYLYTSDQLSYNKHLPDSESLYRMTTQVNLFDNMINFPGCSHVTIQQIVDELPEVGAVARFTDDKATMKLPEGTIEQPFLSAEKSLVDFLNLKFIEGEPGSFDAPNEVLISEKLAYKLDIRGEAVGSEIQLLDSKKYTTYRVTGVYTDIPKNTSIRTDLILPYSYYLAQSPTKLTSPDNFDLSVLLKVNKSANIEALNEKISGILNTEEDPSQYIPLITPLASLHLSDEYWASKGFLPGGNSQLIWFIVIAGIMCLVISIINYANFSISLYINRAREVAVRKIIGSAKSGIFLQLMTESLLTTFISTGIAIILFYILAPQFSILVEKQFGLVDLFTASKLPIIAVIILSIALLSGLYPSFLLSRLGIIKSLKGEEKIGKSAYITKSLLVLQFSISVIMISCMLIFRGQLHYLMEFDRGYDTENVIRIGVPLDLVNSGKERVLMNGFKSIPEIDNLTGASGYGMSGYDDGKNKFSLLFSNIDSSYIDVLGIKILEGTSINEAKDDGVLNGVLVNESFIHKTGIMDPIGKTIPFTAHGFTNATIVGVFKDYYAFGPGSEISPLLFLDKDISRISSQIMIKSDAEPLLLEEKLSKVWDEVFNPIPFKFDYLSDLHRERFEEEGKISKIAGVGSLIAIFISAFGLLGLVGLAIKSRLKELSVRRVLGATNDHITWMMGKKFIVPISLSLLIGIPMSFYLTDQWLANYHNRIDFNWQHGAIAILSVTTILIMIVVVQMLNVTRTNPVVHLKDE